MSIFDILNTNDSLYEEIMKINHLFFHEVIKIKKYGAFIQQSTLGTFIDSLFRQWKHRGTCLSLEEAARKLRLGQEINNWSEDQCFLSIELILNMIKLFLDNEYSEDNSQIVTIYENIYKILEDCNKYIEKVDDKYYVLEKDSTVTAVVDLIDDTKTAISVVAYNYTSNKGNIFEKQKILKILADDFEPRIKRLKADGRYSKLAVDLSFLFNNINIRHNNTENNQTTLDLNNTEELEKYYDMTYRRYLMAVLACEELDTKKQIEAIKK